MLNGDAIQKIAGMAQSEVKEIDGHVFHVSSSGAVPLQYPKFWTETVFSLTQIVSLVSRMVAGPVFCPLLINVKGPERVEVLGSARDKNLEHPNFAVADFEKVYDKFGFGQQLSQEDFIIKLQTLFADSEQRQALLKLVGSVRAERMVSGDDDGISQVAAMRAGVVLVEQQAVKNLWQLSTYRTFPEIEQPVIPYILRLHQRDDEMPKFALYPCDGGKWKVDTTIAIREWLKVELEANLGSDYQIRAVVL